MSSYIRTRRVSSALLTVAALVLGIGCTFEGAIDARSKRIERHDFKSKVLAFTFTPSGDEIVALERAVDTPGDPGSASVLIWPIAGDETRVACVDTNLASDIAVAPRGDVFAVAHDFGEIDLHSWPTGEPIGETIHGAGFMVGSNFGGPRWIRFSPSADRFAWTGVHEALNAADRSGKGLIGGKEEPSWPDDWPVRDGWRVLGFVSEDGIAFESSQGLRVWSIEKREVVLDLKSAD